MRISKNDNEFNTYKWLKKLNEERIMIQEYEKKQEKLKKKERKIIALIKENDKAFYKEEFIAWAQNVFIKVQQMWSKRNLLEIRALETENLFEQHKNQLQKYIERKELHVIDKICVYNAHCYEYTKNEENETLTVRFNLSMKDYIINEVTKNVLQGDSEKEYVRTYFVTFTRKFGTKTKKETFILDSINCPNCGAPMKIEFIKECEYCHSIVVKGQQGWVLSNIRRGILNLKI